MTEPVLKLEGLKWACGRIEDFYSVQKEGGVESMMQALITLREGVGLDEPAFEYFTDWVHDFCGEEHSGALFLGLLVGLLAADADRW